MRYLVSTPLSYSLFVLFCAVGAAIGVTTSSAYMASFAILNTANIHQLLLLCYNGTVLGMLVDVLCYSLVAEFFLFTGTVAEVALGSTDSGAAIIKLSFAALSLIVSLLSAFYIKASLISPFCLSALVALLFFLLCFVLTIVVFLNLEGESALGWFVFMDTNVGLVFQGLRLLSLVQYLHEHKIVCNFSTCCYSQYLIGYAILACASESRDRVAAALFGSICALLLAQAWVYYREVAVLSAQITFSESVIEGMLTHQVEDPRAKFELEHVLVVCYQGRLCELDLREVRRALRQGSGGRFNAVMTLAGAIAEEAATRDSSAGLSPPDWFVAPAENSH